MSRLRRLWDRLFSYECEVCGQLTTNIKTVPYVYAGPSRGDFSMKTRDYCQKCKPTGDVYVNRPGRRYSYAFKQLRHSSRPTHLRLVRESKEAEQ